MRRTGIAVALVALIAAAVLALPALGISDGALDGQGHPYVGLMVALDADREPAVAL